MSTLLLTLAGLALLAIPFVVRPLAMSLANNKRKHLHCVTAFLDAAPGLVSNELLSPSQAELLLAVSSKIDQPNFVLPLIGAILEKNKRSHRTADQVQFAKDMDALSPELRDSFDKALAHGLMAISYSSFLFGWLLRSVWLKPVGMPERSTDAPYFASRAFAHC